MYSYVKICISILWEEHMNKNVKRLSAFLAVLMMSSAFAASASAADLSAILKGANSTVTAPAIADDPVETTVKTNNTILGSIGVVKNTGSILDKVTTSTDSTVFKVNGTNVQKITPAQPKKEKPLTIRGGKFYSKFDAEKELEKFYQKNTHDFYMYRGDERTFCDDVYYVSTDSKVVYYDYKQGCLVAADSGHAYVYVYTTGGVPIFRLNVNVINKPGSTYSTLELIPKEWHLDGAGDTTTFTVVSDKYKNADDYKFKIEHGEEIASITKSGKLTVDGVGPIVVSVSLKSNPNICGEALLYSGEYVSAFYDGYYSCVGGKYQTNYWGCDYDIADFGNCSIKGWIKSEEGMFIPVLKKEEATIGGKDTTIVYYDNVSIRDLLFGAYGNKTDIYDVIKKYNLFKGKDILKDTVTWSDFDYVKFVLSQMIGD